MAVESKFDPKDMVRKSLLKLGRTILIIREYRFFATLVLPV